MSEPQAMAAPNRRWSIGRYTLELDTRRGWRWGISDRSRGVGGYRTPIGALIGYVRWRRQPPHPV